MDWKPGNDVSNVASLQRGAANFMGYCAGCHSLKYNRYSRVAADLNIPDEQMEKLLLLPGAKKGDYMISPMQAVDGEAWFGKAPPDLSLITRAKGSEYVFQFLKTFYVDPQHPNGTNNLALPGTAMPHVLSALQGLQEAKFETIEKTVDGAKVSESHWQSFELAAPGQLSAEEYDAFLRDTVNFLEYAGEPQKAKRQALGVWVILFLLVFTGFAYLLKLEYWKDVK
ncbi:MAG: cytochrome c1 [Gammaproteobacteria bacterium]|nr:cytochrome c1 [Gammaproteobacteria bacterium]MBM4224778.1 cytochrome c1 [Gammaproteobacteria bacterium]MBM4229925.1 cytochrome c1 [Gammaproteobacteria bacterium]